MKKSLAVTAGFLTCLCLPGIAFAEATVNSPAASLSTTAAHVDVTVVIPAVLSLRVGTGGAVNTVDATIDSLIFTVAAGVLGNGVPVSAASGGDISPGVLTVRVYSNVGTNVNLNSGVTGPLTSGGNTIPWSQITVATAALATGTSGFTNTGITHPAFNTTAGGGSGSATSLPAVSNLVMYEGSWQFKYSNASVVPTGSYGAVGGTNGRITYTASQV